MREVFEFVNSVDVRNYWLRENFVPDTKQSVFLVWRSEWASLGEKLDAWKGIMADMPDCPIVCYGERQESLFALLSAYIEDLSLTVENFFEKEFILNPLAESYTVELHEKNSTEFRPLDQRYRTIQECLADLSNRGFLCAMGEDLFSKWRKSVYSHDQCRDFFKQYGKMIVNGRYDRIKIKKTVLEEECTAFEIFPRGDIRISTGACSGFSAHHLLECSLQDGSFLSENQCVFPLPFQKGDLLCKTYFPTGERWPVLCVRVTDHGVVMGYMTGRDHSILFDAWDGENPIDLEYCAEPYDKDEARLALLGRYLKKEIGLARYTNELLGYYNEEETIEGE